MRRLTNIPMVTAGLMWHPEIGPTANAMASRESPNAMATPTLPTFPPAITAVVNPAKTRTNVPNNSAAYLMRLSPQENLGNPNRASVGGKIMAALPQTHSVNFSLKCQRNSTWRKFFTHVSALVHCDGQPIRPGGDKVPKSLSDVEKGHGTVGICHGVRRPLYSFVSGVDVIGT